MPRISPSLTAGGNLDVAVSSRASAAALATAQGNITSILSLITALGTVSTVQRVTVTLLATDASKTATISNAPLTTSAAFRTGSPIVNSGGGGYEQSEGYIELTNATTVTAYANQPGGAGPTTGLTFEVIVVTFASAVSVQSGTIALAAVATNTATISAVTLAAHILIFRGYAVTPAISAGRMYTNIKLTGTTTITATKGDPIGSTTIAYTIVGF